jgi:23S rRNA (uracil1939-C5)-methyltransferase
MSHGGEAIGRDESGRVVFVPYAIEGEEIIAEIVEEKKNYARARLVEILKPSPERVAPRCPHFNPAPSPLKVEGEGRGCGGCQWQHIAYEAQLKFKTKIVREQFARLARMSDAPVHDAIGMRDPWHYRNHVRFQLDSTGHLCFRALESHRLVQIHECHIIHPLLDEMFRELDLADTGLAGVTLRAGTQPGEKMMLLEGQDKEAPQIEIDEPVSIAYQTPDGEIASLVGRDALHERLGGRTFRFSPVSFFQVNTEMAGKLVELVEAYLDPRSTDVLVDAFGGVGTFGLLLAPRVARIIEIEENPGALEDARANSFDSSNFEFHRGRTEDILPRLDSHIDIAVVDPPRAGIAPRALDALIARAPRALAYVSCDPATLARDSRRLVDGGYRLVSVQPVDLFPQTYHIETVSHFERL